MKVSYRWLKEFIDIDMSADELAYRITMAGLEVDSVSKIETYGSVVGEIKTIEEYNSLYFTKIDIGNKLLDIATADKTVNVGDKIPIVESGAKIANNIKIENRKFGDFVSQGMMLSAAELNLEESSSGVLKLDKNFKNGVKLSEIDEFDDYLIEIELTPNRADALSILGVARDVRLITKKDIVYPDSGFSISQGNMEDFISVKIENDTDCPRYTLSLADVQVKESPFFIRSRLIKSGIRPINNIVDITNYVLMALGQPMHAFDLNRLNGNICVRNARDGEKILALDGKTYTLDKSMLVIADDSSPIAIAGVMGGEETSVIDSTKTIALESAFFNPVSVRLTSRKLKLHTESSHRFERGVDPNLALKARNYALSLLEKYANAKIYSGYIDKKKGEFEPKSVICSTEGINSLLGTSLKQKEITDMLVYFNFEPENVDEDSFKIEAPTYRFDIEREADVAEEVARCMGYDKIPSTFPVVQTSFKQAKPIEYAKREITTMLSDIGLLEAINYSFVDSNRLKLFTPQESDFVYLRNSLIEGQDVMRTTLLPGLLDNLNFNINKNAKDVALFEIGRVFFKDDDYSREFNNLGVLMWGTPTAGWYEKERQYDFYDLKKVPEMIENAFNVNFKYRRSDKNFLHPGRSANLFIDDKNIGFLGEVHPDLYEIYGIKFDKRILVCELNLDAVVENLGSVKMYEKLPKLPTVTRDLAIVVDKSIFAADIENSIKEFKYVYNVALFDVYSKLSEKTKKSLAFRITLKNDEKTFTDMEIDEILNEIFNTLKDKFDASLRG